MHSLCEACHQREPLYFHAGLRAALCLKCHQSPPSTFTEQRINEMHAAQLTTPAPLRSNAPFRARIQDSYAR